MGVCQQYHAITNAGRDEVLANLAKMLARQQQWSQASDVTAAIDNEWQRERAVCGIIDALITAGRWQEARLGMEGLRIDSWRVTAVALLLATLTKTSSPQEALNYVYETWLHLSTRNALLEMSTLDPDLICANADIGQALLNGFAWVNTQLVAS